MKDFFKRAGIISIITSIIFAILGFIMIKNPEGTINVISKVIGLIILLIGIEKIINYLLFNGNGDLFNYDLIYGIIAIIIGVLIMVYSSVFANIVGIVIGIWIAYEAAIKMLLSLKLKNAGVSSWLVMLALSAITLLAGVFIVFNQSSIIVATGIVMIIYAVIDLIDEIIFIHNVDKLDN